MDINLDTFTKVRARGVKTPRFLTQNISYKGEAINEKITDYVFKSTFICIVFYWICAFLWICILQNFCIGGIYMVKYNDKQKKWTTDYIKKTYDDIKVRVPKGKREVYKAHAEAKGTSLNKLIIDLLEKDMSGQ